MFDRLTRFLRLAAITFAAALLVSLSASQSLAQSSRATDSDDLILVNGKIITVDPRDSIAQALAIHNGKIVAVGTNDEIRKRAPKNARIVDLRGRAATPGLIDAHCHFAETDSIYGIELSKIKKISEAVADLDKAAPENPVWLRHTTGHYGVANSFALRLAKISPETKDPKGGTIDRDASGRPTGVLKEGAMSAVASLIPPYTREQQRNGLLKMMADFNSEGMTAAKDPGTEGIRWDLYQELLQQNKSTVRIFALLYGGRDMESARAVFARLQAQPKPPQSFGDGMLLSGGVKLYMDGSAGGRTAWVYDPWFKKRTEVETGNTGYPNIEPQTYLQMVKLFHDAGIHVSTHAVGDRAIDWVVNTYADLLKEKPTKRLRHAIIHCNIPTDHALDVMARLQRDYDSGYPETQAPFMWWIGDIYAASFGAKREQRLMPYKTYTQRNIIWAGGSDYPVTPFPARYGLWSSVVRKTLNGVYGSQPFGTAESVDIHTALKSYTIWAAHQLFLEDRIGSLEPGKDADIAVWDRDLYSIPSDDIKNLHCELTLIRGKVVYTAPDSAVSK